MILRLEREEKYKEIARRVIEEEPIREAFKRINKERGETLDLKSTTELNFKLVFYSQRGNVEECIKCLLAGADFNIEIGPLIGTTPLIGACQFSHNDVAALLLNLGADPNPKHFDASFTSHNPLYWAVFHGNKELVELLLNKGADINIRGPFGQHPLMIAVRNRDIGMIDLLLKRMYKVDAIDGWILCDAALAALDIAKKEGYKEVISILEKYIDAF